MTAYEKICAEACEWCKAGDALFEHPNIGMIHLYPETMQWKPCTAPSREAVLSSSDELRATLIRDVLHRFGIDENRYYASGGLDLLTAIDQLQEDYVALKHDKERMTRQLDDFDWLETQYVFVSSSGTEGERPSSWIVDLIDNEDGVTGATLHEAIAKARAASTAAEQTGGTE